MLYRQGIGVPVVKIDIFLDDYEILALVFVSVLFPVTPKHSPLKAARGFSHQNTPYNNLSNSRYGTEDRARC